MQFPAMRGRLGAAGLLLCAAILASCTTGAGVPASPEPATPTDGTLPATEAGDCPDPADTPPTPQAHEFSPDPSWARVCGTSNAGTGQDSVLDDRVLIGPPDALITDLPGLINLVNGLDEQAADMVCTADFGPAYTLVVGYPDGHTEMVTGELFGCGAIGDRVGASALLTDFGQRLRAQREAHPGYAPTAADCAVPPEGFGDRFVQPTLEQTTAAFALRFSGSDLTEREARAVAEWDELRTEMITESVPQDAAGASPDDTTSSFGEQVVVEATNPQCEALTLQFTAGRFHWQQPGGEPLVWTPSESALAILEPYLQWADR